MVERFPDPCPRCGHENIADSVDSNDQTYKVCPVCGFRASASRNKEMTIVLWNLAVRKYHNARRMMQQREAEDRAGFSPCPRCRNTEIQCLEKRTPRGLAYYVATCPKCGLDAGASIDRETAVKLWNRRGHQYNRTYRQQKYGRKYRG